MAGERAAMSGRSPRPATPSPGAAPVPPATGSARRIEPLGGNGIMSRIRWLWLIGYGVIAALFFISGASVTVMAMVELIDVFRPSSTAPVPERFGVVLDVVGLLTIAVAALELGQTVVEEEIIRGTHISAPTRVRRFLSRFLIVVVVALAIECLVLVFQLSHTDPSKLPYAASIGLAAAVLLAAWGLFLRQNRSVEELEPEAMQAAKDEDHKIE
jgi:hypothetical protein